MRLLVAISQVGWKLNYNKSVCPWFYTAALVCMDRRLYQYTRDNVSQTTSLTNVNMHDTPKGPLFYRPVTRNHAQTRPQHLLHIFWQRLQQCHYFCEHHCCFKEYSCKTSPLQCKFFCSRRYFISSPLFLFDLTHPFHIWPDSPFTNSNYDSNPPVTWRHFIFDSSHGCLVPVNSCSRGVSQRLECSDKNKKGDCGLFEVLKTKTVLVRTL